MKARGMRMLAHRGAVLVSVGLLAVAGLAGAPMADQKEFPAFIPMATPRLASPWTSPATCT